MNKLNCLFLLGLTGFFGTANALPVFSHTADSLGLITFSADGTNEPIGLAGLNVDDIIGTAIGGDRGFNYADYFTIIDDNSDNLLSFTFTNSNGLTDLTGSAFYADESDEAFTYILVADDISPPSPDSSPEPTPALPPASSIPEPSTFLLLGAGLIGLGMTRFRLIKS